MSLKRTEERFVTLFQQRLPLDTEFITGAIILGEPPKGRVVRVNLVCESGNFDNSEYLDEYNPFSFALTISSQDRIKLQQVIDILIETTRRENLRWSLTGETISDSSTYSYTLTIN